MLKDVIEAISNSTATHFGKRGLLTLLLGAILAVGVAGAWSGWWTGRDRARVETLAKLYALHEKGIENDSALSELYRAEVRRFAPPKPVDWSPLSKDHRSTSFYMVLVWCIALGVYMHRAAPHSQTIRSVGVMFIVTMGLPLSFLAQFSPNWGNETINTLWLSSVVGLLWLSLRTYLQRLEREYSNSQGRKRLPERTEGY